MELEESLPHSRDPAKAIQQITLAAWKVACYNHKNKKLNSSSYMCALFVYQNQLYFNWTPDHDKYAQFNRVQGDSLHVIFSSRRVRWLRARFSHTQRSSTVNGTPHCADELRT